MQIYTGRQTDCQTMTKDKKIQKTDRQTDSQSVSQSVNQSVRQTDRQTDRQKDRRNMYLTSLYHCLHGHVVYFQCQAYRNIKGINTVKQWLFCKHTETKKSTPTFTALIGQFRFISRGVMVEIDVKRYVSYSCHCRSNLCWSTHSPGRSSRYFAEVAFQVFFKYTET